MGFLKDFFADVAQHGHPRLGRGDVAQDPRRPAVADADSQRSPRHRATGRGVCAQARRSLRVHKCDCRGARTTARAAWATPESARRRRLRLSRATSATARPRRTNAFAPRRPLRRDCRSSFCPHAASRECKVTLHKCVLTSTNTIWATAKLRLTSACVAASTSTTWTDAAARSIYVSVESSTSTTLTVARRTSTSARVASSTSTTATGAGPSSTTSEGRARAQRCNLTRLLIS